MRFWAYAILLTSLSGCGSSAALSDDPSVTGAEARRRSAAATRGTTTSTTVTTTASPTTTTTGGGSCSCPWAASCGPDSCGVQGAGSACACAAGSYCGPAPYYQCLVGTTGTTTGGTTSTTGTISTTSTTGTTSTTSGGTTSTTSGGATSTTGTTTSTGNSPIAVPSSAGLCSNVNAAATAPAYTPAATPLDSMGKLFVGYFELWTDRGVHVGEDLQTQLANIAPYVNVVNLSFMRPEATYVKGSLDLSTTGVGYASGGVVLKAAIKDLKTRNPATKVLISVGGATYTAFPIRNATAIADFVSDFGLDGVDIDFEGAPGCTWPTGGRTCASDASFQTTIEAVRAALPRPLIVSAATWSVGAFGQGVFVCDTPAAQGTGMLINPLINAGQKLDLLNVMTYDAGPWTLGTQPAAADQQRNPAPYYPERALAAYRQIFRGHIAGGVESPPEAWGGNFTTPAIAAQYTAWVVANNLSGMMLWSLQGSGQPTVSQAIAQQICTSLGLGGCQTATLGGK